MFFIKITIDYVTQTPNTKTSDYHVWVWTHLESSFAPEIQPNGYRGYVWQLRPVDIEDNGNAVHEFSHMIFVNHFNDRNENRLMYGNDRNIYSKTGVEIINNTNGYVYPETDLNFHRDWVPEKLQEKGTCQKKRHHYGSNRAVIN